MTSQQVPAPVGIDLGSWTSKIAVAKRGGVEIITNQANFRETPCVVGYGPAERNIGEAGSIKMKSNFKDSIAAPMRFMGLSADYPALRHEKKYCPAKCVDKEGKIAFEVNYQGQKESLCPEQIMAAYLNKLKLIIRKNGFDNKSAVVAIPSYLTQCERKAFLNAAKIAQLQITRLINDSTAIALDYGMFRKGDLDAQTPRNVLFIDFGHSKLSIFTCSFLQTEMKVLQQQYLRNIGCRDIDYQLFQFYREIFEKSSGGCDLNQNRKAVVKVMEMIERQRKILSGNSQHDLHIECLMEEQDLSYTMKREQFEKLCEPVFSAIIKALEAVCGQLKAMNVQLHSIELVGGGTRIPVLLNLVKGVFGIEPSRTLNSSESVARGCALMAAIKSPLFKVPDFALHQKAYYGIKFSWNFVPDEKYLGLNSPTYPQKQQRMIYEIGAQVPTSKTIRFNKKQATQILIEYEPMVPGFNKLIGYFVTKPQHPKEENFGVSFKIKYTDDGLIVFDDCQFIEEWFEQTKVPKKKDAKKEQSKKQESKKQQAKKEASPGEAAAQPQKMQAEEQFQIKKSKKQRFLTIKYDASTFEALNSKEIESYFAVESTMLNQDHLIIETYEKKNELESLAYNWKEKLMNTHQKFAKKEQIQPIVNFLEGQSAWLYSQGQNSTRGIYNERIEAVKGKIGPIARRYEQYEHAQNDARQLEDCLRLNFESLNSLDKKYEHVTPEERQEGFTQIESTNAWLKSQRQKQIQRPLHEQLVLNSKDLKDKSRQVSEKVRKIMSKPVPKVQKPEEKKEQPKAEAAPKKQQKMDVEQPTPQGQKMDVQ